MSGVRGINKRKHPVKGSATVEAAIVMPVFLVVLFSIAYIIRIFHAYNMIQTSLSEVARRIANISYFYHVTGIKDYADQLNAMAKDAENGLADQKDIILNAFDSFNKTVTGLGDEASSGQVSLNDIDRLVENAKDFDNDMEDVRDLIETIVTDPEAELRLFMTIFAQKLSYEATNRLVCLIAKGDLAAELHARTGTISGDAALLLGIKNGMEGISFDQSSVFGDSESLEFTVNYRIKAPVPFGIIPELKLSNRVKIIAWTGGRGGSVRLSKDAGASPQNTSGSSVWVEMDQDNRFWDRGLEVEDMHVAEILKNHHGIQAYATAKDYPVIDAYTFDDNSGYAEYYDVFTLNPFLKTYSSRPSAITSEIKKHGLKLREFDRIPETLKDADIKSIKRIVVLVIPENSGPSATEAFEKAKKELERLDIEVRLVKGYGAYSPDEDQKMALAS